MYKLDLYLIRHGKTICNEQKLYCGFSDIPLSNVGKLELLELKALSDSNKITLKTSSKLFINKEDLEKFTYPECEKYYTSGAKRANETFEILYPNTKYEVIKEFWEYNFGDFEMKSYEILKGNKSYINWIMDKEGKVEISNGESKLQYRARISKAFRDFLDKCRIEQTKSALLVSHGGTIGTILELFYSNERNFYEWQPQCGCGYKLEILWDKAKDYIKIDLKIISIG